MRWWIKLIAALAAAAVMVWLGVSLVRGITTVLGNADFGASEPDPMFAEEPERIERPLELYAEEIPPEKPTLDDYVPEVESPVDMTVEELIEEAKNGKI